MNRVRESRGNRSPLLGLFVGGVVVLLAQVVLFLTDLTHSPPSTAYRAAVPCVYEVFEDSVCLGTVFCDRPQTVSNIQHMLGRSAPGKGADLERCVPCGSSIKVDRHSSLVMVSAIPGAKLMAVGKKIDLNRALESDLLCIPGIGPVLAQRIVREREHRNGFKSVEDVRTIYGIGEKKWQTLVQWLEVGPSPSAARERGRDP